jgi:hypothetical protein
LEKVMGEVKETSRKTDANLKRRIERRKEKVQDIP